jgi:hypothetical protein
MKCVSFSHCMFPLWSEFPGIELSELGCRDLMVLVQERGHGFTVILCDTKQNTVKVRKIVGRSSSASSKYRGLVVVDKKYLMVLDLGVFSAYDPYCSRSVQFYPRLYHPYTATRDNKLLFCNAARLIRSIWTVPLVVTYIQTTKVNLLSSFFTSVDMKSFNYNVKDCLFQRDLTIGLQV